MDNFDDTILANEEQISAMNEEYSRTEVRHEILGDNKADIDTNPIICIANYDTIANVYRLVGESIYLTDNLLALQRGNRSHESLLYIVDIMNKCKTRVKALLSSAQVEAIEYSPSNRIRLTNSALVEEINYTLVKILGATATLDNLDDITSLVSSAMLILHYIIS